MTENFPILEKKNSPRKVPEGGNEEKHIGKIKYGQWIKCNYPVPNSLKQNVMQMVICMLNYREKRQVLYLGGKKGTIYTLKVRIHWVSFYLSSNLNPLSVIRSWAKTAPQKSKSKCLDADMLGSERLCLQDPALPLPCCLTLGKRLDLSELPFLHL